jgi:sugar transferase (PEP-CTERM/EpsH1 system associated)
MKILYVCHRFPYPPKRGGKIRPFNMIRHLSEQGHEVTVCSLARSREEAEEAKGIAPYCARYEIGRVSNPLQAARMLARLPTTEPSSMGFFYSPDLARSIGRLLATERFGLVFVHCSSVAQYVRHVRNVPKILDFGDMDSQKWLEYVNYKPLPMKVGYWLEGIKLRRSEERLAGQFDMCTATTRAEWETLDSYGTGAATDWFPNGVDTEYFRPDGTGYDSETVSFVGRMDYYPNQQCMLDFCRDTWPLLRSRRPQLKLKVVGADPSPAIRRLGDLPGVEVTGSVPDVRPHVGRSAVMVAPLSIARGTQNKILESMAMGVPVVASRIAAGGVDAEPNRHLLVADTPAEQAASILRLVESPADRARLALAGRERMVSHHAWGRSMRKLDAIVERCVSGFGRTEPGAS